MINTILLSKDNKYVSSNGELPQRGIWDKKLLTGICKGGTVSVDGYNMLPPSIRKFVGISPNPSVAITIPEIANKSHLLLVSRSKETLEGGKVFRLDDFQLVKDFDGLELWYRIN